VPGSYTFGPTTLFLTSGVTPGPAGGTIVVCVDSRTALSVAAGFWSPNEFRLTFDGVEQYSGSVNRDDPWITTPVGPGCGTLRVTPITFQISIPDTLTVTVSKA
jgi:hypothetical protein